MAIDAHSQRVVILKVALPLMALAILSALFLVSSRVEPGSTLPFASTEVAERIRDRRVSGPFFSGVSSQGDKLAFNAEQLVTAGAGTSEARNLAVRIDFYAGGSLAFVSDTGTVNLEEDSATLQGNILIESSTGYRIYTEAIKSKLSSAELRSLSQVRAIGPAGQITAQTMTVTAARGENPAQVHFGGGVEMIYDPGGRGEP